MKWRLLATALILAPIMAFGGAAERFSKVSTINMGASANRLFVPSYNSQTFRPDKITVLASASANGVICSLTVYIPSGAGPITATDSAVVVATRFQGAGGSVGVAYDYYGPTSDTMRVSTGANTQAMYSAFD